MNLPPLEEIEMERKKAELTQTELSKLAGVSQSLIARIESKRVDPRYSKVKKIFDGLSTIKKEDAITAQAIMTKNTIYISPHELVETAIKLMRKNGISQLPVIDDNKIVGSISEETILNKMAKGASGSNISIRQIKDLMDPSFPTVDKETPLEILTALLEHSPAVIIQEKGETIGIIAKSNLLKTVHK